MATGRTEGTARKPPPALVRRWEGLHIMTQVAIVLPIAMVAMWALHITLLNQPQGRAIAYGVFWGVLLTAAIVGASRSEKARRDAAARRPGPRGTRP
jgi:hypothetical protein